MCACVCARARAQTGEKKQGGGGGSSTFTRIIRVPEEAREAARRRRGVSGADGAPPGPEALRAPFLGQNPLFTDNFPEVSAVPARLPGSGGARGPWALLRCTLAAICGRRRSPGGWRGRPPRDPVWGWKCLRPPAARSKTILPASCINGLSRIHRCVRVLCSPAGLARHGLLRAWSRTSL